MSAGKFTNFLGRDNVLVNVDTEGYSAYVNGRQKRFQQENKIEQINNITNDIEELKNKFSRIEDLLIQVLEKNK